MLIYARFLYFMPIFKNYANQEILRFSFFYAIWKAWVFMNVLHRVWQTLIGSYLGITNYIFSTPANPKNQQEI